jgi:hypothetical protein
LSFTLGVTEQMRLTSTGLGIGTSSPLTGLSLSKSGTQWTNNSSNTYPVPAGRTFLQMEAQASQANWFGFTGSYGATSGSANLLLQVNLNNTNQQAGNYIGSEATSAASADLTFGRMVGGATTGSNSTKSEQMRLDSSGNLGLGVTPSAWGQGKAIEVFGQGYGIWNGTNSIYSVANAYFNGGFKYAGTGLQASHYYQFQGAHVWSTAPSGTAGNAISFTQAMTLDASGNLGVGTTSPARRFSVVQDLNAFTGMRISNSSSGTSAQAGCEFSNGTHTHAVGAAGTNYTAYGVITPNSAFLYSAGSNDISIAADGNGTIKFGTGTGVPERARIDSSGNFMVGKTGLDVTAVGFEARSNGDVKVTRSGSTSATTTLEVYSTGASAYRFYVGMDGTINATSIVISAISDQRLKENVRDIDTGLDAIMALKPRRFDWKEGKGQDKKDVAGFIAQEFETVFPECVGTSKAGEDGIEYKNINHETLIPTLVKAIQELKAEFDAYKASHP